jgi:hypothetical protein
LKFKESWNNRTKDDHKKPRVLHKQCERRERFSSLPFLILVFEVAYYRVVLTRSNIQQMEEQLILSSILPWVSLPLGVM